MKLCNLGLGDISGICVEEWSVVEGMGTLGGQFTDAASLEECLNMCLADPECVAVDVNTEVPFFCFSHTNDSLQTNNNYSNTHISHYRLLQRCEGKSPVEARLC